MPDIKVGSYVKWEEGNDKKRGVVTAISGTTATVKEKGDKTGQTKLLTDLKISYITRAKSKFGDNMIEVAENVVLNSILLRMFGHKFTGSESVSFLCADALYEIVLKDMLAPYADILRDRHNTADDEKPDAFFKLNDIKDAGRKLPFTVLLTAIAHKVLYGGKFMHNMFLRVGTQAGALYATNIVDRMIRQDKDEDPLYVYP